MLYQHDGGLCTVHRTMHGHGYIYPQHTNADHNILPYIAIETVGETFIFYLYTHSCTIMPTLIFTGNSGRSCAMGFLRRKSLDMIVDAPRDDHIAGSLHFSQQLIPALSMPLNVSGQLMKFVIAAKFNHRASAGWPVLQIRRTIGDGSDVINRTTVEPTSTGYLNVFEYKLSADIHPGDRVHIIQSSQPLMNGLRFLLAYLRNPPKPMVHIEVLNNNNQFEHTTSPSFMTSKPPKVNSGTQIVNSGTIAAATVGATTYEPAEKKTEPVIPISIGVLCSLITLVVVFAVIIVVVLTYRLKKYTIHSINTSVNIRFESGAADNVYIPDNTINAEGAITTCGQVAIIALSQDNPEDVSLHFVLLCAQNKTWEYI